MQIIVPMSGYGERFRAAGYEVPKPLIEVDGKPIIAHVVDLFPGETEFVFVCNEEHLAEPRYRTEEVLKRACPTGRIVPIAPHRLGPVWAVLQAARHVDRSGPVVVNYCDFTCVWDYDAFRAHVAAPGVAGCVPAYRGFHPHMLGPNNYAFLREEGGRVTDVREKEPFTDDRTSEYASSGTYYFSSGGLMLSAFERCMSSGLSVGGEYYVSLAYKPLLEDGGHVTVFEIDHFMQWGTPGDLEEYRYWSDAFRALSRPGLPPPHTPGTLVMPMAGAGSRFASAGYDVPKPLLPVGGTPMVVRAASDLPATPDLVFVTRQDLPGAADVRRVVTGSFPDARFVELAGLTDGQARTCLLGAEGLAPETPLHIGACDNGLVYDGERLSSLLDDPAVDVVVWTARGYPGAEARPRMYGWVETDGQKAVRASVKVPLSDPSTDAMIVGAFSFRRAEDFRRCVDLLVGADERVNGELYVDSCVNAALRLGLDVRVFDVDFYLCWGTPDDLSTYEYWRRCFSRWASHPYRGDPAGPAAAAASPS